MRIVLTAVVGSIIFAMDALHFLALTNGFAAALRPSIARLSND